MELPKCENCCSTGNDASHAPDRAATVIETVDAGKINALADTVRARLTSDVYGNFDIAGNRLGNDSRHNKLREVVELTHLLEDVKALMARKNEIAALEAAKEARAGAKPNALQLATVREMIQEELDKGLRDLRIENTRMKERMLKAEEGRRWSEAQYTELKQSIKKVGSGEMKGIKGFVKEEVARYSKESSNQSTLEQRLARAEEHVSQAGLDAAEQMRAVAWTLVTRISNAEKTLAGNMKQQADAAKRWTILEIVRSHERPQRYLRKLFTEMAQLRSRVEGEGGIDGSPKEHAYYVDFDKSTGSSGPEDEEGLGLAAMGL